MPQNKNKVSDTEKIQALFKQKYTDRFCFFISKYALTLSDCFVFLIALLISKNFIINSSIVFYKMETRAISQEILLAVDWHYLLMFACVFYFRVTGHYTRRQTIWEEAPKVFFAILFSSIFDFFMLSISSIATKPFEEIKTLYLFALLKWFTLFLFLLLSRDRIKRILSLLGLWQKPTVIIGTGDNARQTYLALSREKSLGFDVKLFIDINKKTEETEYLDIKEFNIPIIQLDENPNDFFKKIKWPHVVIALEEKQLKSASKIIDTLTIRPNALDIVPPVRGLALYGLDVTYMFGSEILLLRSRNNLARFFPRLFKRCFDLVATIIILIIISPLFLIFALLIKKDGGAAFYGHKRIGQNGKPFFCYKFRSMVLNADKVLAELLEKDSKAREEWEKDFKLKNDPRVTKIGKLLRTTSLDELPQLFNVLKGEMSLVGPRPIVQEEVKRYGDYDGYYKEVKPGVTGLWQISGRNDIDYSYRVRLDVWYIKNWSFWYDIVILLKTIPVVFNRKGAY